MARVSQRVALSALSGSCTLSLLPATPSASLWLFSGVLRARRICWAGFHVVEIDPHTDQGRDSKDGNQNEGPQSLRTLGEARVQPWCASISSAPLQTKIAFDASSRQELWTTESPSNQSWRNNERGRFQGRSPWRYDYRH